MEVHHDYGSWRKDLGGKMIFLHEKSHLHYLIFMDQCFSNATQHHYCITTCSIFQPLFCWAPVRSAKQLWQNPWKAQ